MIDLSNLASLPGGIAPGDILPIIRPGSIVGISGGSEGWSGSVGEMIVISGLLSTTDQATFKASQRLDFGTP